MSKEKYFEEELFGHHSERKPLNFTDVLMLVFLALVGVVVVGIVLTKLLSLVIKLFPAHA
jgi:hypothetical protein